jgi:hypothetical protein
MNVVLCFLSEVLCFTAHMDTLRLLQRSTAQLTVLAR